MRSAKNFSLVFVTAGNEKNALTIARKLLSNQLAACVNLIHNVRSLYRWKNKIEDEQELMLIIKTQGKHVKKVEELVRKHHTYDVPEIVTVSLDRGSPKYLAWLANETK